MSFHVGQRVVCVKSGPWSNRESLDSAPSFGLIYTIRNIKLYDDGVPGLHLAEVVNKPRQWREGFHETTFAADRFRPVDETRIEIFRQMLNPVPKRESADA